MGEDSSDDGYVKVWSSDSKVEEVLRETHGKCQISNIVHAGVKDGKYLMVKSVDSMDQQSVSQDGGNSRGVNSY